jgi:hypothetical protein
MSRILITFYQNLIDNDVNNVICFYESLSKELSKYGNKVLLINIKLFTTTSLQDDFRTDELNNEIKQFNPNLIITFNNQISDSIIENTNCPIALFEADSDAFFCNKNAIPKYKDRYYMVSYYKGFSDRYKNLGFEENRIIDIHLATSINSEILEKDKNISFIGSKFVLSQDFKERFKQIGVYKALQEFWETGSPDYYNLIAKYCSDKDFSMHELFLVFDSRNYILSSVLDLGLSLYGKDWNKGSDNIALMSAFNKTSVFSLKHNQDIYNSSKIALSISHPQTEGYTFPWRCYDIMASSGMLISSYSKLLEQQTKGIVNIPMYHSPYQARELCKKYLTEPALREDIIKSSNEFIEKYGRWKDNFEKLEHLLNVKLINTSTDETKQNVEIMDKINLKNVNLSQQQENVIAIMNKDGSVNKLFSSKEKSLWIKIKHKTDRMILALKFFIVQFLFIDLFISEKSKTKLYDKIGKLKEK